MDTKVSGVSGLTTEQLLQRKADIGKQMENLGAVSTDDLIKRREENRKQREALEAQTQKNLAATQAIVQDIPERLGQYAGKAFTGVSDLSNTLLQKAADYVTKGNAAGSWEDIETKPAQQWSTYLAKRGVPSVAQMSDYLPGYAEQGQGKWWQPEKEGMLDWNVRDVGGAALDTLGGMGLGQAAKILGYRPAKNAIARIISEAEKSGNLNRTMGEKLAGQVKFLPSLVLGTSGSNYGNYFGTRSYMNALRPIDEQNLLLGKKLLSPRLLEDNVFGGPVSVAKHIDKKVESTWARAKQLAEEATQKDPVVSHYKLVQEPGTPAIPEVSTWVTDPATGAKTKQIITPATEAVPGATKQVLSHETGGVDMSKAMAKANEWLDSKIIKNGMVSPNNEDQYNVLRELTGKYAGLGNVNVDKATEVMADLYKGMPNSAYQDAVRHGFGVDTNKKIAAGIKEQIKNLHPELDAAREEFGQWVTPQEKAWNWANKNAKQDLITPSDFNPIRPDMAKRTAVFKAPKIAYKWSTLPTTRMMTGGITSKLASMGAGIPADLAEQLTRQQITRATWPEEEQ